MRGARSEYRTEPGSILVPGVSGVGKMVNHRQGGRKEGKAGGRKKVLDHHEPS